MPLKFTWKNVLAALALCLTLGTAFWIWERPDVELETRVVNMGRTPEKVIAITIDDGPHPVITPLLLDILERNGVHATFFVVGKKAVEYPELLRRIAAGGHEVACHTFHHFNITDLTAKQEEEEIDRWRESMTGLVPAPSHYFRPPGGDFDRKDLAVLRRKGCTLVLWTLNPGDWKLPPARLIVQRVMWNAQAGDIVLMHDDGMPTIHALPVILKKLKMQGYRFVTVSEMMQLSSER